MHSLHDVPAFKLVLLGDSGVGKTSISQYFERGHFDPTIDSTIAAAFTAHELTTPLGKLNLHIWDTAGQERYRSLIPTYARGAAPALLVFDLSSVPSFENINHWVDDFALFGSEGCLVFLVGNKADLPQIVKREDTDAWAQEHSAPFFEVSAKTGVGVMEMFDAIAAAVAEKRMTAPQHFDPPAPVEKPQEEPDCC
jgi:small GTP-binding protein